MIKNLRLKFGKGPGAAAEAITSTPVTVFVGPNNSGKSKVLAEIYQFCATGKKNATDLLLDEIEFESFSSDDAEEKVKRSTLKPKTGEAIPPDHILVGKGAQRIHVPRQLLVQALQSTNTQPDRFCQWHLQFNTLKLDGRNRIDLINDQAAGDLQGPPHSSFQTLFRDDAVSYTHLTLPTTPYV